MESGGEGRRRMRGMRKGLRVRGWEGVGAEERKRQKGEAGRLWQRGEAEGRERKKDIKREACVEVGIC